MTAYFNQVNKLKNNLAARKLEKRIFKYFLKSNQMMTCKSLISSRENKGIHKGNRIPVYYIAQSYRFI